MSILLVAIWVCITWMATSPAVVQANETDAHRLAHARSYSIHSDGGRTTSSASSRTAHLATHRRLNGKLLKAVRQNPALVMSPQFIRRASHVSFALPIFIRLNKCMTATGSTCTGFAASNDTASLVVTALGLNGVNLLPNVLVPNKTLPLQGGMQAQLLFKSAGQSGNTNEVTFNVTHISVITPRTELISVNVADLASCTLPLGVHETWLQTGHMTRNTAAVSNGVANFFTGTLTADLRVTVDSNDTIQCALLSLLGVRLGEKFTWTSRTANNLDLLGVAGRIRLSPGITRDRRMRLATLTASAPATNGQSLLLCNNDAKDTGAHDPPTTFPPPQSFCSGDLSGTVNVSAPALSAEVIIGSPCAQSMYLPNADEGAGPPNQAQTRDCPARNPS